MKIEYVDNMLIIYYFDEINVDNYVEEIIKCAKKRYNLKIYGLCTVNVYKDSIIILEIINKSVDYYDYNELDINIKNKNSKILYEIDIDKNIKEFYKYKDKIYIDKYDIKTIEFINIIYKNTDNIIKTGKIVVNNI